MRFEKKESGMDSLKKLRLSIALFIFGAVFLFTGLAGGFELGNYKVSALDWFPRASLALIGGLFVVGSIWIELRDRSRNRAAIASSNSPTEKPRAEIRAEEFFYTLDDKSSDGFPNMVKNATCVQLSGRTAVNLMGQYGKVFERLGKDGCQIQLLFVDPLSEAAKHLYGGRSEVYRHNILSASQHLKLLKSALGDRLQVRVTKHAPTSGIIIIQKEEAAQNFVQVQLYFLYGAIGRDRPLFKVRRGESLYSLYADEFAQLWNDGVEWDMARFSDAASALNKKSIRLPNCPFCKSDVNEIAFAESQDFLAIYNVAPILPGHSLIIPKFHVHSIKDLDDSELSLMMTFARDAERILSRTFETNSFNWTIQQGEDAGQTVPHLHLHLIPRRLKDLPHPGDWYPRLNGAKVEVIDSETRQKLTPDEMKQIVSRIKDVARKI